MFFVYSPQLRADIEATLSVDRLAVFRQAAAGDLERAIDLYCWNAAMAAAFFGPLGIMEVGLRNALDRELIRAFTVPWYDDPKFLAIDSAFAPRIYDTKKKITARGKAVVQPRVIAELSFGFWVNLLRPGPGGSYVHTLWGPALSRAFRPRVKRSFVAGCLDPLLKFRNRVAHHEPIFSRNLGGQYASILWIIGQVAPNIVSWVQHHARVNECITNGPCPPKTRW
jgi:hypothetical protein